MSPSTTGGHPQTFSSQALGASQKVFEHLDHIEEIVEKPGAPTLDKFERRHRLRERVVPLPGRAQRFSDSESRPRSEGRRGGGPSRPERRRKTTVANLAPRFYDVVAGAIKVDGHDVRDLNLAGLRRLIGIVAQDTFLFNDHGGPQHRLCPGPARLWKRSAARRRRRWPMSSFFVCRRDTGPFIGDRGLKLSGRPRGSGIAIARALLERTRPILILDEATSHLRHGIRNAGAEGRWPT